ncbi:MAG: septal ring lytic transglycosylase RlpA family protein [Peptococcaceae bacterium]|nr:septal ring lytic transglycosylase RlpA family protein [Peptococcaceae bacterium]
MNSHIRKFIAATAIVAVGSVAVPMTASAQDTAYIGSGTASVSQASSYLPLRSALNAVGVDVHWENTSAGQKIALTYGGQTLEVSVDAVNGILSTANGSYAYSNIGGSLHAGLDFYQSLFSNATVSANGYGGIYVTANDASQAITLAGVSSNNGSSAGGNYTYYESGQATWYGSGAQGNYTASGEIFNMYDYTAAHKYLPFGSVVRVTDNDTGRSVVVRINDRGPFGAGRVIDLSYQAASDLGIVSKGVANVTLEVLS